MTGLASCKVVNSDSKIIEEIFEFGAILNNSEEYLLIPSAHLCLKSAEYNSKLGDKVFELLSTELMCPVSLHESNTEENRSTYKTLARGLLSCSKIYPKKNRQIIQKLLDYLTQIYAGQTPDEIVREEVISCLCEITERQMKEGGVESIKWILDSLSNTLLSTYSEYMRVGKTLKQEEKKKTENQLIVLVVTIGRITCHLNNSEVSDHVVPNLINRITYPDLNFDAFIIDQLTKIALLGQKKIYLQVVSLLLDIYKNCLNYPDNMFIHDTIPNAFSMLATGLNENEKELRNDLLIKILKLFQLIANQIYRKEPKQRTAVLGFLGMLLPVIGQLIDGISNNFSLESFDSSTIKLFNSVWYYCVIYRFAYVNEWANDWFIGIKQMANKMPPLTSEKSTTVLESILILDSFNLNAQETTIIKRELAEIISRSVQTKGLFTSQFDSLKSLTSGKCLYLLSVYHLETLRAKCGNMYVLFNYLEEPAFRTDIQMSQAISIISDQVFQVFLNEMNSNYYNKIIFDGNINILKREDNLMELIYVLLISFVHNDNTVRKAADKYILQLLDHFPQLLWNRRALTTLLDLTQAVGNGAEVQGHATLRLNLPNSKETITLPEDFAGRKSLLKDISELCTVWLQTAKKFAPIETDSVLQEYCQQFQKNSFGFLSHQGYSIIVKLSSYSSSFDVLHITKESISSSSTSSSSTSSSLNVSSASTPSNLNHLDGSTLKSSNFVYSLNLKSLYLGEIGGMVQISNHLQQNISDFELIFTEKIKNSLFKLKENPNLIEIQNQLNNDLCTATAFLISQKNVIYRELIHYVCWVPILIFTIKSIETGIFIWTWLLASRPDLSTFYMK